MRTEQAGNDEFIHQTARMAIARCLADVEDFPEAEHFALADDVLLAIDNAGIYLRIRAGSNYSVNLDRE